MKELQDYRRFTRKAEFDKAVNSLLGLVEGIAIDSTINESEIRFLESWLEEHRVRAERHPFSELFPVLQKAISDCILSDDERQDIAWLCKRLTSSEYFNASTTIMQKLHGILAGVAADAQISVEELQALSQWLQEHDELKGCWPYDEVESLILNILEDGKIDAEEHAKLLEYFSDFAHILDDKTITNPISFENAKVVGICAVSPEIRFRDAVFCITGVSSQFTRAEFHKVVSELGGTPSETVTHRVNYLIIGADGNPCWAYACYGRKVEQAVQLRKKGHSILIVHENDFHDAVADQ
jgi:NAD-dependent DNA ligase